MNDWNSLRYNGECKLMSFWPFWPFLRMVTLGQCDQIFCKAITK